MSREANAEDSLVEPVNATKQLVAPGAEVGLVFYEDTTPHALTTVVGSLKPFATVTSEPAAERLHKGQRVVLIFEAAETYARAEAEVTQCTNEGGAWRVEVGHFGWEEVDRRRFARYKRRLDVRLRSVQETDDGAVVLQFEGWTEDLSLGGAWIRSDARIEPGSLMEFSAMIGLQQVRILALVAREAGEGGFGVEFLDFVGSARYFLHGFLESAA